MWRTDTPWFMAALIMAIFAIGGVLFGRFEQHKPRGRRVMKQILGVSALLLVDVFVGRFWAFGLLALLAIFVVYIHAWWLPKHGINGWTAEPYDRYLALVRREQSSS